MADFDPAEALPANGAESMPDERLRRRALFVVFLVVFIDLFGFGIVLPLLPRYAREFLEPLTDKRWLQGMVIGLLAASFSAMQFIFAPIWGRVSDRVGRRPILLMGLFSSVVFYALFGIASGMNTDETRVLGLVLMFVSRLGAGIAGATLGTAQAVIADSTPGHGRARGMAIIGAAFGIGFTFGPLLAIPAVYTASGPGLLASALSLIALILGFRLLPETRRPGVTAGRRTWFDREGLRAALRTPPVGHLILIFFLSTFAFANFEPTLALLTRAKVFDFSDKQNYLIFAYVGFILALAQGGLYRPLARRVREISFMFAGTVLMAVGLGGIGWIVVLAEQSEPDSFGSLLTALLVLLAVAVTGFSFMTPSVQALISRLSDPNRQGEVLGLNQSASAMARILGPAVGLPLYTSTPTHLLPYAFGAMLLVLVLLVTLSIRRQCSTLELERKDSLHAAQDAPSPA